MDEIPILKTEKKEYCNGIFTFMAAMKDYLQRVENQDEISSHIPEPKEEQTVPLIEHLKTEPISKRFTWKGRQ
ncbi:unnamed protein product [Diamesa tonsa]